MFSKLKQDEVPIGHLAGRAIGQYRIRSNVKQLSAN